jgi:membrane protease YdiL (CAAX protease family)
LVIYALVLEAGCLVLAFVLSLFGFFDRSQPLTDFFRRDWIWLTVWTAITFVAIVVIVRILLKLPWKPFRELRDFILTSVAPMFSQCSVWQLGAIAASAGIGEEMLFRWALQGGLQSLWPSTGGTLAALLVAALAFGLVHAMTTTYVVATFLVGLILGTAMIVSGSVLPSVVAHAAYDLYAFLLFKRLLDTASSANPQSQQTE